MNRVGIMVDLSHPSKQANLQAIALSKAPVIASHSAARALCDHSRDLDDEQLLAIKKNGGVVQTVAFAAYVKTPPPPTAERSAALTKLEDEFGLPAGSLGRGGRGGRGRGAHRPAARRSCACGAAPGRGRGRGGALAQLPDDKRADAEKRLAEIDKQFPPPPRANVKDFVDHIDYIVKKIGIDHVGISSDFDGGGGVDGWNDASETFNVTLELVRRGYTEDQIAQDLERQPAARDGGGPAGRAEAAEVARELQAFRRSGSESARSSRALGSESSPSAEPSERHPELVSSPPAPPANQPDDEPQQDEHRAGQHDPECSGDAKTRRDDWRRRSPAGAALTSPSPRHPSLAAPGARGRTAAAEDRRGRRPAAATTDRRPIEPQPIRRQQQARLGQRQRRVVALVDRQTESRLWHGLDAQRQRPGRRLLVRMPPGSVSSRRRSTARDDSDPAGRTTPSRTVR